MKTLICTSAAAVLLLSAIPASAATQYTYAPVIETVPVYEMVRVASPRENCWTERVVSRQHARSASNTPVILSTIIGGALGNAVGHGKSNRRVGTVVGAVLGHSVGRDIVRNSGPVVERYEDVRRCETVNEYRNQERLVGYSVRYRYNGEDYTVRMDRDPGARIQLRVRLEPVR